MGKANRLFIAIAILALGTVSTLPAQQDEPTPVLPPSETAPRVPRPYPNAGTPYALHQDDSYLQPEYCAVHDTYGWPVALPYSYYPQGAVNDEGVGIYQSLVPPDPADVCFCTPPPCYFGQFYVEGLVLDRRSSLESMTLFVDSTGAEVLNTNQLDLETEAGFRAGFWICDPCGIDWNFDYFSVQNFQTDMSSTDPAGVSDQFFGLSNLAPTTLTAEYESNLDSLEFTVRTRQWRRIAPLVGVRFIQVNEQFNSLLDVTARAGQFSETDNELFGLQFGFQGLVYEWPCWCRLETTVKAGPYYNDIDIDVSTLRYEVNSLAFAGDGRVGLVCQLGPRANFRISYQVLWLEGIALGPNQNNNISLTTNVNSLDLSGVLYQGGSIGFDVTW